MLRSMYSGISGMKGFQRKLDVIGNNIANVNTTGFKKGRVTFQDMMSQTSAAASGAVQGGKGGTNPMQVGLGSKLATIDTIHTQGFQQTTDRPLDFAIEGDGMFAVTDGTNTFYTRAGNFSLDENGDIVNAQGYYLLDTNNNHINIDPNAEDFSIQSNGTVTYLKDGNQSAPVTIGLAKFSNPEGLEKVGNNLYRATDNSGLANNGALYAPESGGAGKLVTGALEMSNVDLSEEFTEMITAQRGFQANTRIITTSDEILQELVNLKR
ncbi:flagellar basal body rod protein FlgG [Virgibacillus sp. 179-BFC.A HS]|uniref:Flagellar basal body rod protein FlgG n=1 Tax=Tigheibacillus jepli TaxID=3035914 RepID=A0ABU5CHS3_9BACI|nr:flagellar basal body rod protein FlgG [Virgibacillus sp. 179-BFC.A HS]MDY0405879.1 flagellar basal body rod protein FlgG [Virgibacillus sp. 179-BFC.A HS]